MSAAVDYLDPATPVTITEPARLYTATVVARSFCWCGAVGSTPCRTRRGRATADHVGRVR